MQDASSAKNLKENLNPDSKPDRCSSANVVSTCLGACCPNWQPGHILPITPDVKPAYQSFPLSLRTDGGLTCTTVLLLRQTAFQVLSFLLWPSSAATSHFLTFCPFPPHLLPLGSTIQTAIPKITHQGSEFHELWHSRKRATLWVLGAQANFAFGSLSSIKKKLQIIF